MSALLAGLIAIAFALCPAMLVRNLLVFRARSSMLRSIRVAAHADIAAGRDWRWRYDAFDQVTYEQMMYRPWKRLRPESWYADTSFLGGAS